MKRKILSLILVLMLFPIASLFSACGDKGYNLNNLQNDFSAITTENENVKYENGKYVFDYSRHDNLNTAIEFNSPYSDLEYYNQVYENLMAFTFDYIDECSDNNAIEDADQKDKIENDLIDFKASVRNVDKYINQLAGIINSSNLNSSGCISGLENLFLAYEDLFVSASNLNNTLANLYFNHVLINPNPNISEIEIANFDANVVTNLFDARIKYQKSLLTHCFVEMYVCDGNLAEQIVNGYEMFNIDEYDYQANILALSKNFNAQVAGEKANNAANKQTYYNLSVQACNMQEALKNDNAKFIFASNSIKYAALDYSDATAEEKLSIKIVEAQYELALTYNAVLSQMLTITAN